MKRLLDPTLNPLGLAGAIGAIYSATMMIWNVAHHHGAMNSSVLVAGIGAMIALLARPNVTPIKDPRDGNGKPLSSSPAS